MHVESNSAESALDQEQGLKELWMHVEQNWDNEAAHAALLSASSERKALAPIAKLYRMKLDSNSESVRGIAQAQLEKITALAFAQLEPTHREPRAANGLVTVLAAIVSMLLIGACIFILSR